MCHSECNEAAFHASMRDRSDYVCYRVQDILLIVVFSEIRYNIPPTCCSFALGTLHTKYSQTLLKSSMSYSRILLAHQSAEAEDLILRLCASTCNL